MTETAVAGHDLQERFTKLAAPIPLDDIAWRRDGRPTPRGDKMVVRVVAYISAQTVQRRLDSVFCGDWDLSLDELPDSADEDGVLQKAMKATLRILGLSRQDVGLGSDPKNAATDSFKRAAMRYGIAAELYDYPQVWVELVNGNLPPTEEIWAAYSRALGRGVAHVAAALPAPSATTATRAPAASPAAQPAPTKRPSQIAPLPCPVCGGKQWDNSKTRTGRQPDYKCMKSPACNGATWLEDSDRRILNAVNPVQARAAIEQGMEPALIDEKDDLPF